MTFRTTLTHNGASHSCTSLTLDAALAVAKAFEHSHAGDREAYTEVREMDGSVIGTRRHFWWGGAKIGPRDTRHPMERLMVAAVRSGRRCVISDGQDTWVFGDDTAPDPRMSAHQRAAA